MEAFIYAPTVQALTWRQAEPQRAALIELLRAALPARAYAVQANVTVDQDFAELTIGRLSAEPLVFVFDALERPLPFIARLREFWYPHLASQVRPERHPRHGRSDALAIWGPPRATLSTIRDSIPVNDPRTGHYVGRAFWRVDRQGYWGCWSDSTEHIGPALTLAELQALLNAARGIFAD
ncbi:MAG: hypothetical protein HXY39_11910 [Chloroflexi bacterium]|nr:hypothetical protein [Chloroflexota bacterium]